MKRNADHFRGCLIGGALGDALGAPVEFLSHAEIERRYGTGGIQELKPAPSGKAVITDDTQMTIFTAEGILRAAARGNRRGISHPPTGVFYAYQRWLLTQGYPEVEKNALVYKSWLLNIKQLFAVRGPGRTCLSALKSKKMGSMAEPVNSSKGCGGVMRAAPAGLFYCGEDAFRMGAEFAALTHGHPSGYLSAGALACLVAALVGGADLEAAIDQTLTVLGRYAGHAECTQALQQAVALAHEDYPDLEAVTRLGEGWVGEEALAIAVYCALKYRDDFKRALIAAVNHSGDSDSTGAITGNILGAYLGLSRLPADWVEKVELQEVLLRLADDLLAGYEDSEDWRVRYPDY